MTTESIPSFTLNNGVEIPAIGFGVFQIPPDAHRVDRVACCRD
jgi:diketogulonate reductase-like aldo/keto reductase